MAYLTFAGSEENTSFKFIGANSASKTGGLISSTTSLISEHTSLLSASVDGGMDTCSFYSGPSEAMLLSFGDSLENFETCGSIAYSDVETCGTIAYSGGSETCGSIASVSTGSSCAMSYSC